MSHIKFYLFRDVKTPRRAFPTTAGIDVFVPKFDEAFMSEIKKQNEGKNAVVYNPTERAFYIQPHSALIVPSGFKYKMEASDRALIAKNKTGFTSKNLTIVGFCVADSDYQGEEFFHLINVSTKPVKIVEDQPIIQLVEMPVYLTEVVVVNSEDELFNNEVTTRGTGAFGHTDKK